MRPVVPGLLAPASVVALLDHGQVVEIALDARGEVVLLSALDERETAAAARPPPPRCEVATRSPRNQPRPFGADHEDAGARREHDRNDAHGLIVVPGLRRRGVAADTRKRCPGTTFPSSQAS